MTAISIGKFDSQKVPLLSRQEMHVPQAKPKFFAWIAEAVLVGLKIAEEVPDWVSILPPGQDYCPSVVIAPGSDPGGGQGG